MRLLLLPCLLGVCQAGVLAASDDPAALLREALELKTDQAEEGNAQWRDTLSLLRIANAMRLHGLRDEALEAARQAVAHNVRVRETAIPDETIAELCRMLALLGETEEAAALARTVTLRRYDLVALFLAAQSLSNAGEGDAFEEMARSAIELVSDRNPESGDDQWLRGMVRLALRDGREDLARELLARIRDRFWLSAAMADFEDAEMAADCPDPYVRVIACGRAGAVDAALKAADEVGETKARDAALRIAARKLAEAGRAQEAGRLAEAIRNPGTRFLAEAAFLTRESHPKLLNRIDECPPDERPLLAEALTAVSGSRGLLKEALASAELVPEGRARFRALDAAAGAMIRHGFQEEAARVLDQAAGQLARMSGENGETDDAHRQLALRNHRLGRAEAVDEHLGQMQPGLPLAEAALAAGRLELARETILHELNEESAAKKSRDRLVSMLVEAGDAAGALAAVSEQHLSTGIARGLLAYRLAEAGEAGMALEYVATLDPEQRADALVEMSLAGLHRESAGGTPGEARGDPVVAVTVHGSWRPWFPRLERLGIEWALMAFSEPYELGGEALSARYAALGFPGGNSHADHTSPSGIESLRGFLDQGGGFFGICAGQFLATHFDLVPTAEVYHPRGDGPHQVQIVKQHPVSYSLPPVVVINRRNGGFLKPGPGCDVVGWYDDEGRYAALVAASPGNGRLVVFSPHPEGSSGFDPRDTVCNSGFHWLLWGTP